MSPEPDIATLASAVTEPARAAILVHLLDGRSWTATELARIAGIRAPAASAHLKRLLECELIKVSPTGRHRYFRLAGTHVAKLVEQLQGLAPTRPVSSPGQIRASTALRACRFCYDHLAGQLAVSITEAMVRNSWLIEEEPWYRLTERGTAALAGLAVEPAPGRTCMDWSERKLHLAGVLDHRLAESLLQKKLLLRDSKTRVVRIPMRGQDLIADFFGFSLAG